MLLYNCPHIHHHHHHHHHPPWTRTLRSLGTSQRWRQVKVLLLPPLCPNHHGTALQKSSLAADQCPVDGSAKTWHLTWGCGLGIKLKDKVLINNTLGIKILVRPFLFRVPSSRDTRSRRLLRHGRGSQQWAVIGFRELFVGTAATGTQQQERGNQTKWSEAAQTCKRCFRMI